MEEREAVARLKRGDLRDLETLVHKHYVQAVRSACLITRDRALAEDIVQNAFIRAYVRISQFDLRRPFGPWFLRSVVNDAVKAVVREGRQISLEAEEAGMNLADALADPAPGPLELAEAAETRQELWAVLGRLVPAERAIIVKRYYLDLSEAEMATESGPPIGTIKRRLHTARKHLRDLLRPFHLSGSHDGSEG